MATSLASDSLCVAKIEASAAEAVRENERNGSNHSMAKSASGYASPKASQLYEMQYLLKTGETNRLWLSRRESWRNFFEGRFGKLAYRKRCEERRWRCLLRSLDRAAQKTKTYIFMKAAEESLVKAAKKPSFYIIGGYGEREARQKCVSPAKQPVKLYREKPFSAMK